MMDRTFNPSKGRVLALSLLIALTLSFGTIWYTWAASNHFAQTKAHPISFERHTAAASAISPASEQRFLPGGDRRALTADGDRNTAARASITQADLSISKGVAPASAKPGETVTFTVIYTNTGSELASGVVITDIVPVVITNVSYSSSGATLTPRSGATYIWDVADLAPGEGGTINITGVINPNLVNGGIFTNTVTIATASTDPDSGNNSASAPLTIKPTVYVNSTGDSSDAAIGDGLCDTGGTVGEWPECTLRAAIEESNASSTASNTINFTIPISDPGYDAGSGVFTILPGSPLPTITDKVHIDGSSQPGANCSDWPPTLLIQLDGSMSGGDGLVISIGAFGSRIRGLVINRFAVGIRAENSDNHEIQCNFIGTDPSGTLSLGNSSRGIQISSSSNGNLIGSDGDGIRDAGERNLISGNPINVEIVDADDNHIAGNYIGTHISGTASLTSTIGVRINGGSERNLIGTNSDGNGDAAERNLISGNTLAGVQIDGSAAMLNRVAGNLIGTDLSGIGAVPNATGILLSGGAQSNLIGSDADGLRDEFEGNLINFNTGYGIFLDGSVDAPAVNTIRGNTIAANGLGGIASERTETGDGPGDNVIVANTISANSGPGVLNVGASPVITANSILDNGGSGIASYVFFGADASPSSAADDLLAQPIIGGSEAAQNTISGNCAAGAADCAGIFSLDTAPDNAATLAGDNGIGENNGAPFAEQRWYGTLEIISDGAPVAGSETLTSSNGGPMYTLTVAVSCSGVLSDTIIHGTNSALSCEDARTWPQITHYVIDSGGTRTDYTPQMSSGGVVYSFDADATTHPTNTGAGFGGEGVGSGFLMRYQVMEVGQETSTNNVVIYLPLLAQGADSSAGSESGPEARTNAPARNGGAAPPARDARLPAWRMQPV